jgi:histidinol-phosphate aminotransferase
VVLFFNFPLTGDDKMKSIYNLSRRKFLQSAAALSFVYLPGIGRVKAQPYAVTRAEDYTGRLCYNENPLGPSPLAISAMNDQVNLAHRYPDWYNSDLEEVLATHHGVSSNTICVGAGATEIIRLIADAFLGPGDELITATPTYFQMASEAATNGASVVYVPLNEKYVIDLNAISEAISDNTRMISLVNPNNPLGTIIHKSTMKSFLQSLPRQVITVVDEAYHHYVHSSDYESGIRFVNDGLPVIVIRTFSKVYGLAGARIGYSISSSSLANQISTTQLFGTVSNVSQAAAVASLADSAHLSDTIALNDEAKGVLKEGLIDLRLDFIESETNFMMFDTGADAEGIVGQLDSHGYQVRTGWGMPQHIRISTGTLDEMNGFINALGEIVGLSGLYDAIVPKSFALNTIYPNPFNSHCQIEITTVGTEKTNLTIYDINGRKIKTVMNKTIPAGNHRIRWDGRDIAGKTISSGVYIFNLIQGEMATSRRATLIK